MIKNIYIYMQGPNKADNSYEYLTELYIYMYACIFILPFPVPTTKSYTTCIRQKTRGIEDHQLLWEEEGHGDPEACSRLSPENGLVPIMGYRYW